MICSSWKFKLFKPKIELKIQDLQAPKVLFTTENSSFELLLLLVVFSACGGLRTGIALYYEKTRVRIPVVTDKPTYLLPRDWRLS